jgi:RNA recognition motif-containing protein
VNKKLYVGNLDYNVSTADVEGLFAAHGTVESVQIIEDRTTGQSKGFGFVEMSSSAEAQAAVAALDGHSLGGRALKVNEAKPRPSRGGDRGGDRGRRW